MSASKHGEDVFPPVDLSPQGLWGRLRSVGVTSDLRPGRRLDAKLDMSATGIARRLMEVSSLLITCRQLARIGNRNPRQ